jgi:hypothetical protein
MISPDLIATLEKLSPTIQSEVLNYAEYLAIKYSQAPPTEKKSTQKYRQAGTMQGMFVMTEDFDAPLEDLSEYM